MILKEQMAWLIALLSSSCCILQLILNYFSISCAGFAIFTPYRPLFTSITLTLLTYNLYYNKQKRTLFSVVFSVMLMISPEVVQYINQHSLQQHSPTTTTYYYRIHLDGLGCEACGNRIKNTLNTIDWISNTRVYFNNKTAIVETIKKVEDSTVENVIKSIDLTKYDAQVLDSWVLSSSIN
jgi:copper chaperone CopZ